MQAQVRGNMIGKSQTGDGEAPFMQNGVSLLFFFVVGLHVCVAGRWTDCRYRVFLKLSSNGTRNWRRGDRILGGLPSIR